MRFQQCARLHNTRQGCSSWQVSERLHPARAPRAWRNEAQWPSSVFVQAACWRRYSGLADWEYIGQCAQGCGDLQLIGNGDVFTFQAYEAHLKAAPGLATAMIARAALIKPWLFTEVRVRSGAPLCCFTPSSKPRFPLILRAQNIRRRGR